MDKSTDKLPLTPELEARVQRAVDNFMQGYGCCQSVVAAFADLYNLDDSMAKRIAAGVRTAAAVLAVNGDGTLLLQAGKMKMTVKAAQVRLLETAEEIEEKKKQAAKSRAANGGGTVQINTGARASAELDIRGLETLEAESVVENYLDAAQRSKLGSVTIIHGKGTGALRAAVHQMLKKNRAVKSFRLGRYGEGEAGVTVVELK